MLSDSQLEQVRRYAEEVAVREGCLLYDLEFHEGPPRSLRVFIDRETAGVSIGDCANVSRGLNLRLDVEDVIPGGHYDLEVSSPGMDRKLSQLWHFNKAVGQQVRLQWRDPEGSIKPYEGKLEAVDGSKLRFANNSGPWEVDFANVTKARIHLGDAFKKKPAPGKNPGKKLAKKKR